MIARTRKTIDANGATGFPNVIAFAGHKWRNPTDPTSGESPADEGAKNCVNGLKELAIHAERKNVTVCVEMLNARDDSHPMKGLPDYLGDDMDYAANIIKKVGSPRVKLLFDIYHLQVMNGYHPENKRICRHDRPCGQHLARHRIDVLAFQMRMLLTR